MRILLAGVFAIYAGVAAAAECVGTNLIDAMPAQEREELAAAVADIPYHDGILWRVSKGEAKITLVGTYHFPDPRHQKMLDRLKEPMSQAAALYVEAGPEEEAKLEKALTEDPSLMVSTEGPTLAERLNDEEWKTLSQAMEERGVPVVMASRLRPWYVALMSGLSPCMLENVAEDGDVSGLDHLLTAKAQSMNLPIHAVEPWDTVFDLFSGLTPEEEIEMIRMSLPAAQYADDYAITLTDAYFSGDVWTIWEFGRFDAYKNTDLPHDVIDKQMELSKDRLMDQRNHSWIETITSGAEKAAKNGKGIVVAVGALHLPGNEGVLRLLEDEGWIINSLD